MKCWVTEEVILPYRNKISNILRISSYVEIVCITLPWFHIRQKKKNFLSLVDHWYLRIVLQASYPTGPIKNPLCIVNSKSNFKQYVIKNLSQTNETIDELDSS